MNRRTKVRDEKHTLETREQNSISQQGLDRVIRRDY